MSIFKRIAEYFAGQDEVPEIELSGQDLTSFAVEPKPCFLEKSAAHVSQVLTHARAKIASLESEIAAKQEDRRKLLLVVEAFEPVLVKLDGDYSPAAAGAKSYDVAIQAKRNRGDRHFRKPEVAA